MKIAYYKGVAIQEMTKEQLIETLEESYEMVERQRNDYLRELNNLGQTRRIRTWLEVILGV